MLAVLFSSSSWASHAMRVRAKPKFTELRLQTADGATRVVGSLVDERHQPLVGVRVEIVGSKTRPCVAGGELTDDAGQFCYKLAPPADVETLTLKFDGSAYLDPASFELPLAEQPQPARIEFTPNPLRFEPGAPLYRVQVHVKASPSERTRYALRVTLLREGAPAQTLSGPASVAPGSPAELTIPAQQLGRPGPVRLLATLTHPSGHVVAERSVHGLVIGAVALDWLEPLNEVRPTHGFTASVSVTSDGQPLDSGWVEVLLDGQSVGMAEVAEGTARVTARFETPRRRTATLEARYLPGEAWLRPGEPLRTPVELLGRSPWSHLPWIVLGLGTLLWLARTWRRPLRRRSEAARTTRATEGGVSVLERARPEDGWQGVVRDAHTSEPVADAQVSIVVPSLTAGPPLRHSLTTADGSFELAPLSPTPEGARLVVQAARHSSLDRPLPSAGSLSIEVVTRRRTLLEVFVRWTQHRARTGTRASAPTPSEVSARAERQGELTVARWADDIERAAFGPTAPDAEQEAALIRATPPLDRSGKLER